MGDFVYIVLSLASTSYGTGLVRFLVDPIIHTCEDIHDYDAAPLQM